MTLRHQDTKGNVIGVAPWSVIVTAKRSSASQIGSTCRSSEVTIAPTKPAPCRAG
jgi:hypothetical protein